MKLVARTIAALALVAFATPALPCGAEKSTHTAKTDSAVPAQQQPAATVAKADKTKKADRSQKAKRSAQSAAATN